MQTHSNEEPQEEGENKEVSAAAFLCLLENEWRAASPDDLRRQLREAHELLIVARRLIEKQRAQLEQNKDDIKEAMKPRAIPKLSESARERIRGRADEARARLRAKGFYCPLSDAEPLADLVKRLRGLLEAHGMTAAQLARILDLAPNMTAEVIGGHRLLTPDLIRKLSAHFALPEEYFL